MPRPRVVKSRHVRSTKEIATSSPAPVHKTSYSSGSPLSKNKENDTDSLIPLSNVNLRQPPTQHHATLKTNRPKGLDFHINTHTELDFPIGFPIHNSTPIKIPAEETNTDSTRNSDLTPSKDRKRRKALDDISNDRLKRGKSASDKESKSQPREVEISSNNTEEINTHVRRDISKPSIAHSQEQKAKPTNIQTHMLPRNQTKPRRTRLSSVTEEMVVTQNPVNIIELDDTDRLGDTTEGLSSQRKRPLTKQSKSFRTVKNKVPISQSTPKSQPSHLSLTNPSTETSIEKRKIYEQLYAENGLEDSLLLDSFENPQEQNDESVDNPLSLGFLKANMKNVVNVNVLKKGLKSHKKRLRRGDSQRIYSSKEKAWEIDDQGISEQKDHANIENRNMENNSLTRNETIGDTLAEFSKTNNTGITRRPRYNGIDIYESLPLIGTSSSSDESNIKDSNHIKAKKSTDNKENIDESMRTDLLLDRANEKYEQKPLRRSSRVRDASIRKLDIIPLDENGNSPPLLRKFRQFTKDENYDSYQANKFKYDMQTDNTVFPFDTYKKSRRILPARTFTAPSITEFREGRGISKDHDQTIEPDDKHDTQTDGSTESDEQQGSDHDIYESELLDSTGYKLTKAKKSNKNKNMPKLRSDINRRKKAKMTFIKEKFDSLVPSLESSSEESSSNEDSIEIYEEKPVTRKSRKEANIGDLKAIQIEVAQQGSRDKLTTVRKKKVPKQQETDRKLEEKMAKLKAEFEKIDKHELKVEREK